MTAAFDVEIYRWHVSKDNGYGSKRLTELRMMAARRADLAVGIILILGWRFNTSGSQEKNVKQCLIND